MAAPRTTVEVAAVSWLCVDRDRWITISKIAVPLGTDTAMAVEVVGVCVLMGIPDLVLHKGLTVHRRKLECLEG